MIGQVIILIAGVAAIVLILRGPYVSKSWKGPK